MTTIIDVLRVTKSPADKFTSTLCKYGGNSMGNGAWRLVAESMLFLTGIFIVGKLINNAVKTVKNTKRHTNEPTTNKNCYGTNYNLYSYSLKDAEYAA